MAKKIETVALPKEKLSDVAAQVANIFKAKGAQSAALHTVFSSGVAAGEGKAKAIASIRLACGGSLDKAGNKAIAAINADTKLSAAAKAIAINAVIADEQYQMSKIPLASFRQVRLMFKAADFSRRAGYGSGENALPRAIGKLCAFNVNAKNPKKEAQRSAQEDTWEVGARDAWREMLRKANMESPESALGRPKPETGTTGNRKAKGKGDAATPTVPAKPATPSNVVEFPAAKVKTVDAIARVVLNVAAHLDAMEKQSASAMTGEVGSLVRDWIKTTREVVAKINEASAADDKAASAKAQAKAKAKQEKLLADEAARVVMKQG